MNELFIPEDEKFDFFSKVYFFKFVFMVRKKERFDFRSALFYNGVNNYYTIKKLLPTRRKHVRVITITAPTAITAITAISGAII